MGSTRHGEKLVKAKKKLVSIHSKDIKSFQLWLSSLMMKHKIQMDAKRKKVQ